MVFVWKLTMLSIVLAIAFSERSVVISTDQQKRDHPFQSSYTYNKRSHIPQITNNSHALIKKCEIEIPNVSLKAYPLAKVIRPGSSMQLSIIETCCNGFRAIKTRGVPGSMVCSPVCNNCWNGECVKPDECKCFDGFIKSDNGDCVFTCPISCLNGQCYLDGTCKCQKGYKLDESKKFCRPICSEGCNGFMHNCTSPETCGCSNGYTLKENGCRPICKPHCGKGGSCKEPNICTCNEKYELKNGVCQSDCYQRCENGICLSKHRCICFAGFKYHEKTSSCIPE